MASVAVSPGSPVPKVVLRGLASVLVEAVVAASVVAALVAARQAVVGGADQLTRVPPSKDDYTISTRITLTSMGACLPVI
jgi:hypothetical protein